MVVGGAGVVRQALWRRFPGAVIGDGSSAVRRAEELHRLQQHMRGAIAPCGKISRDRAARA